MTPAEYKACIARLGLNQREAGELLGATLKTSQAWAQGYRNVPETVVVLLTLIEALGVERARKILTQ